MLGWMSTRQVAHRKAHRMFLFCAQKAHGMFLFNDIQKR